jgi:hypothetical protein
LGLLVIIIWRWLSYGRDDELGRDDRERRQWQWWWCFGWRDEHRWK